MQRAAIEQATLVITAEQIRTAPREVRQWFYALVGAPAPETCIIEHNGFRATEEHLALLDEAEACALIARLEDDAVATELLVQFSDDCWDPASGIHQAHRVSVSDIVHNTSIGSPTEVRRHLDRIEEALRAGRGDNRVMLFQGNSHLGYSVHPVTQTVLHRLQRGPAPARLPSRGDAALAPPATEAAD